MALAFDRDFAPRTGEAVTVAPGVIRVTAPNPGPFTFHGTNTHLIGEPGGPLAVLDPGPDDPHHLEALLRAIDGAPIAAILVSHTHRDHSPLARALAAEVGAPILASGPHRTARPPRDGETALLDASADLDFAPDRALADGERIAIGAITLEAVATPGHAANHLAFAWPERGLLFSGDHVMGWATTIVAPPDGSMADYMRSLEKLLARAEATFIPAHGGPVAEAHAFMRGLRAHRRMREAAILDAVRLGDATLPVIVARVYAGIAPALVPAAALSALAHLEELCAQGRAISDGPPSLAARYRAAPAG